MDEDQKKKIDEVLEQWTASYSPAHAPLQSSEKIYPSISSAPYETNVKYAQAIPKSYWYQGSSVQNWGKNPCAEVPMIPKSGTPWWPPEQKDGALPQYWSKQCICGHNLGVHGSGNHHKCGYCSCPTFSLEEEMPTIKKDT